MRDGTRGLRIAFAIWGSWEVINGALATFASQAGANMIGWIPKFGWSSDVLAMSAQYGMGLFLLGFVYLLAARDPRRYALFVWVAVAEQGLGILIGFNGTFVIRTITIPQFFALVVINAAIAAVFLRLGEASRASRPLRERSVAEDFGEPFDIEDDDGRGVAVSVDDAQFSEFGKFSGNGDAVGTDHLGESFVSEWLVDAPHAASVDGGRFGELKERAAES
ncbi:MAG: hypothetical protein WCE44_07660 [Candidatus Velthaea sp.]